MAGMKCFGLCNFDTEFLIAAATVVDPVVCLAVVGLGVVGRVYPRDSLIPPTYLRLASVRRCL